MHSTAHPPWYLNFEDATPELLRQIKRGRVDGDYQVVIVEEWKEDEDERS
jgi:hypothetical protein